MFRQILTTLRDRVTTRFGVTHWVLHLRPGMPLLPGQAVLRVFDCREETMGSERVLVRTASCGLAVAVPVPSGQAVEAQVTALETAIALSDTVQHVLACSPTYRIPDSRVLALDVVQRPGQENAWFCQAFIAFEITVAAEAGP